ncbi:MAG: ParB N-terminal domain-containing protein [Mycobacteriales bacterium]|nr:MAG: hypothetical protein DLM56_11080 [Pseudonocardiales bacterium]
MTEPFQVMPPLTAEEYAALRADIAEHGVIVPVVVDEAGVILDGHHRAQVCAELGVDFPTVVRAGLDDAGKRSTARALNMARRHLTRTQRRQIIADEIRADTEASDRAIGRRLGVDHKTVASVRRELRGDDMITDRTLADALGAFRTAVEQLVETGELPHPDDMFAPARAAIAAAENVDREQAVAALTEVMRLGQQAVNLAAEVKIRAQRDLGEAIEKVKAGLGERTRSQITELMRKPGAAAALAEACNMELRYRRRQGVTS